MNHEMPALEILGKEFYEEVITELELRFLYFPDTPDPREEIAHCRAMIAKLDS
jgi:hypothetical protein